MSRLAHLPIVHAATLLAVLACGLSGCSFPKQCGDARVTEPSRNFFLALTALDGMRDGYAVQLPVVSLSKEGTTEFNVRGLPPGSYDYRFFVTGGALQGMKPPGKAFLAGPAALPADLADTVITFRATTPTGKSLLSRELRLAGLHWTLEDSTLYAAQGMQAVRATDYHLAITVRHPSTRPGVTMHIDGFGAKSEDDRSSVLSKAN